MRDAIINVILEQVNKRHYVFKRTKLINWAVIILSHKSFGYGFEQNINIAEN